MSNKAQTPTEKAFPAMPLYVRDWLAGQGTSMMSPEQRGAFIDLLAHAWQSVPPCTLPDDDAVLAQLSRLGRRWASVGAIVRRQFVEVEGGRLQNPKQIQVYRDAVSHRAKRAASGAQGGRAKAANAKQEASKNASTDPSKTYPAVAVAVAVAEEHVPPTTPARLLDAWNEIVAALPKASMTPDRQKHAAARLREHSNLDEWREVFRRMDASPLCRGERPSESHPNWRADFDFALKPGAFARVREGKYDERSKRPAAEPDTIWTRVLERIEVRMNQHTFSQWFQPTALISDDGDRLVVSVPNQMHTEWIQRQHAADLRTALEEVGRAGVEVVFMVKARSKAS